MSPEAALALFHTKYTVNENGCWIWNKASKHGYASFYDGRGIAAHRWSHIQFNGPIPAGYHVDHLCCQMHCVNPAHLEAVTRAENIIRRDNRFRLKRFGDARQRTAMIPNIDPDLWERFKILASERDMTITALFNEALTAFLDT